MTLNSIGIGEISDLRKLDLYFKEINFLSDHNRFQFSQSTKGDILEPSTEIASFRGFLSW
jgi:hypothetical protein